MSRGPTPPGTGVMALALSVVVVFALSVAAVLSYQVAVAHALSVAVAHALSVAVAVAVDVLPLVVVAVVDDDDPLLHHVGRDCVLLEQFSAEYVSVLYVFSEPRFILPQEGAGDVHVGEDGEQGLPKPVRRTSHNPVLAFRIDIIAP